MKKWCLTLRRQRKSRKSRLGGLMTHDPHAEPRTRDPDKPKSLRYWCSEAKPAARMILSHNNIYIIYNMQYASNDYIYIVYIVYTIVYDMLCIGYRTCPKTIQLQLEDANDTASVGRWLLYIHILETTHYHRHETVVHQFPQKWSHSFPHSPRFPGIFPLNITWTVNLPGFSPSYIAPPGS